jgi:nucleoid-associated protein YgaU
VIAKAGAPAVAAEAGSAPAAVSPPPTKEQVAGKQAPTVAVKPPVPQIIPKVVVTAVEADTAGSLFVAGTVATRDPIRVYLDGVLLGETKPTEGDTWLLEVHHELAAGTYKIRADQIDPASGEVMVGAEVPFEREIEVATLRPVGETGGPGGASAAGAIPDPQTVIVKRYDNLWQISRRMYGNGTRWSTLYVANKEQIRKPRWIFPGQVFTVPAGDMTWKD